jgi:hypothetical protein
MLFCLRRQPLQTPSQDFIFIGIRFCSVGLMFPPPDRIVEDNVQSRTLSALKVLSGKGILMSHWPSKLGDRSNPTREVVSPTSSTSSILQMETTSGSPGSGNSPSRSLLREVWKFFGTQRIISIRECCYNHPLPNFPCSQSPLPILVGEPL